MYNRFVESKNVVSGKSFIGRVTVSKTYQNKETSEVLVQDTGRAIFKQNGKCYIEKVSSEMSKMGMPSGVVPCPGEKSANEAAYATAMGKWLNKQ
ncbi:hypothetical protein [Pseudoalteromonas denitrificans]|uniref:Uncharacterized protein n=1 Tax=Pseudoalteromonas denitrificans DSM 6059 TaxID=1123010 RepID=A0A1I1RGF1_9GAMM|nr:hypothetical protein [Pseudoalteromonas denitrificans]SFD29510.1 hypothetical protein SAMN02745724_04117 [Pseudoalteromonas denitrificans DSM 6059]